MLIGVSCNEPDTNCFCTSFDDSPANPKHLDILFTDIGDYYYVEVVTEKGEDLIKKVSKIFSKATDKETSLRKETEKTAIDAISRKMNTEGVAEKLNGLFDHEFWFEAARGCIGCGICEGVCPCGIWTMNDNVQN